MKYVVMEARKGNLRYKFPVMFPNHLVHANVAKAIARVLRDDGWQDPKPRSAGEYNPITCECHGNSETLKLEAHIDDSGLIANCDYGAGAY